MIYLFHGTDIEKVRAKAFEWVAKARVKEPNLAYVRLSREELSDASLQDAIHSGGLFVSRLLVLINDPFPSTCGKNDDDYADEEEPSSNILEEHIDALAKSDNAIVILAPKLIASKAKKLLGKVKVEYTFNKPISREVARGFNSALVDALGARSRERLWLEINRALFAGDAPEMLLGLLHWKARDIMQKGSRVWKPLESRKLSLEIISLLQESRRGGLALGLALERFALGL